MIIGHFATAVAAKPLVPEVKLPTLFLAAMLIDIVIAVFFVFGLEGFHPDADLSVYGGIIGNLLYSHSLVASLAISVVTFFYALKKFHSFKVALVLAFLVFSHWILDLIVHHPDMCWLPGNYGDYPLLGMGLWAYPSIALGVELSMCIIALTLFYRYYYLKNVHDKLTKQLLLLCLLVGMIVTFHLFQMP